MAYGILNGGCIIPRNGQANAAFKANQQAEYIEIRV